MGHGPYLGPASRGEKDRPSGESLEGSDKVKKKDALKRRTPRNTARHSQTAITLGP